MIAHGIEDNQYLFKTNSWIQRYQLYPTESKQWVPNIYFTKLRNKYAKIRTTYYRNLSLQRMYTVGD